MSWLDLLFELLFAAIGELKTSTFFKLLIAALLYGLSNFILVWVIFSALLGINRTTIFGIGARWILTIPFIVLWVISCYRIVKSDSNKNKSGESVKGDNSK